MLRGSSLPDWRRIWISPPTAQRSGVQWEAEALMYFALLAEQIAPDPTPWEPDSAVERTARHPIFCGANRVRCRPQKE
jgi:hypothetical protein